ncbi:MAG TPA: prepilin-type N-terminal cleavage/methylation domain-containing protein [Candidatus Acidoferrum sp.]|nr:prepilin-type N-terminal cleavage/methylation domain-containing protein [Candidatus Acidoferrum sp.]
MKRQSGFTLVEFSVAMAVTLVALLATVMAFRMATYSNQNVSQREDMADNIRAGLNLLEQDVIMTGMGIPTGGITIPTFAATSSCPGGTSNLARPLPTAAGTFPACNTTLPSIEPGNALGPFITAPDATSSVNTDVLTVVYADNTASSTSTIIGMNAQPINGSSCPGGSISASGNAVTFATSCFNLANLAASGVQINPGDLIMFSNTNGKALQEVTSVSGQTLNFASGDAFRLNGITGAVGGTIKQLQNSTVSAGVVTYLGTYPPTSATRVWVVSYWLDNVTDPIHIRLDRAVNFNAPQPVGETLENLQFTFNFNDGVAVNQLTVPSGYSESQIRSVNLFMSTRSTSMLGQTRQYARENFQTQLSLRSMAYVNRYQ